MFTIAFYDKLVAPHEIWPKHTYPCTHTHAQSIFGLHYVCCDVVCVNGGREPSPLALSVQKVKCKMNVVFIVISCVYYECQALRSHSLHVAVFSISLFVLYTKRTRRNT